MAKKEEEKKHGDAGVFVPAGLFIGFAVGFLINNIPVGIFGGLGLGFLLMGIASMSKK